MANEGRSLLIGRVLTFLAVCAVVVWAGAYLFHAGQELLDRREAREAAAKWDELKSATVIAGTPLMEQPQLVAHDYNYEVARLLALHNSRNLTFTNAALIKAWAQIESDTSRGILLLERIGTIDDNKPSILGILAKATQDDDNAGQKALAASVRRIIMRLDESDLEKQFRDTEASLNTSIGGLQAVADGLSHKEKPGIVSVKYFPSWDGIFSSDTVQLQNMSSDTLENATVIVTVKMKDGSSRVHLHYVDKWQTGSKLKAFYPYQATAYANAQAGANPGSIDAAIYMLSGTTRSTYALTPEEWDNTVKHYCSGLTFNGSYLGPYSDSEGLHPSGFQFQFHGLPELPIKSVEVRFTSSTGGDPRSEVFTYQEAGRRLAGEEIYKLRSKQLDGDTPGHIDYILRFSGTNYEHAIHFY